MGQGEGHIRPLRGGAPLMVGGRIGEGGGDSAPPFLPPSLFPLFPPPVKGKGGGRIGLGAQVGFLLLGRALGCLPPSPSFIYVGRAPLEHTSIVPSRVRHPPPQLTPRSYRRSA